MTESKRPKQTAFRLPQRTKDALDKMIEEGNARNRTDAVILAVDKFNDEDSARSAETVDYLVKKLEYAEKTAFNLYLINKELIENFLSLKRVERIEEQEKADFLKRVDEVVKRLSKLDGCLLSLDVNGELHTKYLLFNPEEYDDQIE